MAGTPVEAESLGAVVNIDLTVRSSPAVDAYAEVSSLLVVARGTILTRAQRRTLVHVHRAVPTWTPAQSTCDDAIPSI